jgi:hypothetical protein
MDGAFLPPVQAWLPVAKPGQGHRGDRTLPANGDARDLHVAGRDAGGIVPRAISASSYASGASDKSKEPRRALRQNPHFIPPSRGACALAFHPTSSRRPTNSGKRATVRSAGRLQAAHLEELDLSPLLLLHQQQGLLKRFEYEFLLAPNSAGPQCQDGFALALNAFLTVLQSLPTVLQVLTAETHSRFLLCEKPQ